ncbi:hypothetical protein COP2_000681 [Malus domestica]
MKRKPTSEIFGYRQSKTSLNFSSSSVGSTLRSYCCTKGLIHTVLINDVTSSCWKCGSQTSCNGSRVMPPLGNPTHAIKYLSPKEDFIQIAHRVPRPQEPDKALCCPLASSNGSEDRDVFPYGHSSARVVYKPHFTIWEMHE